MDAAMLSSMAAAATAFALCVGLAVGSAWVEATVAARASGRRRRRGIPPFGLLADAIKLLSKAPVAGGTARALAAMAALLPAVALVAALPTGAGTLSLLPAPVADGGAGHLIVLVALAALASQALLAPAASVPRLRRRQLLEIAAALTGSHVVLVLCATGLVLGGADSVLAGSTRATHAWPLWRQPIGAVAFVGALALLARSTRHAFDGHGKAPGLLAAPGVAAVLLPLARHLLLGAVALLGAHLYGGRPPAELGPAATMATPWLVGAIILALAVLVHTNLTDKSPEGLARLAWTRLAPLGLLQVVLSLLATGGWLPWS